MTDPSLRAREISVDRVKIFKSSMKPIRLTFINNDTTAAEKVFSLMYKEGDDLRKDQLISQFIIRINNIWLSEGTDLRITHYNIVCTGSKYGGAVGEIIQLLLELATIDKIKFPGLRLNYVRTMSGRNLKMSFQTYYRRNFLNYSDPDLVTSLGERVLVTKSGWPLNRGQILLVSYIGGNYPVNKSRLVCWKWFPNATNLSNIIRDYNYDFETWLREMNPNSIDFDEARDNFIYSLCGYSIIQYVLGIADRHPSNIMLQENGRLVHLIRKSC
eukprot:sb/3468137/